MSRIRKAATAVAASAAITLLASACTGQSSGSADDDAGKDVTITFWHGWSAPGELKAINDNVARFEKAHPNIHVKVQGNITDDKINQALRAGGSKAPDVVSSFTTDNVGQFCSSSTFADLAPFLQKSDIDPAATFPKPMLEYTQFEGKRCSLPLLGDAYGLYYNTKEFAAAGITAPPKTLSEFKADAVKLTKSSGDSYSQLGFMPDFHGYESTPMHVAAQWGVKYFDAAGKSQVAKDPGFAAMFTWQQDMVKALGGFAKLEKFRSGFGDEFGAKNPLHTGQVAMGIDGEWRAGMAKDAGMNDLAVAPFPVPDDQAATYGKGYLSGTIIGIANTSAKKNAAWELVKFMTTDTDAVVSFANAIHNVPSTLAALKSPKLDQDPSFKTFLDIAQNPNSTTTPPSVNGGAYQVTLQDFGYAYESGKAKDLTQGLKGVDTQVDKDIAQAK
ncbi:extracellular solute-binding protein [Actinacidiphila bryophytorum]|uniref:Carbohydrate ABC transporter substrate-binding protein, CUT1 family n=1 Tax=Actinacidiphila bryophytorum TaxID=1436133 RepID=A0A9W4E3N8_9ACTN|nr:extracellular solute-binding protein [Actinacidiphila bryophytorum]MBM9434475.1 extracellular solute-binding protein [Actinacidiphila bryophytorum]MBN6545418.1 extracellular solute-binding protein [Actinacidiphila bryophytorum]CAG7626504.1 Carbohydrate ABC transporter substrate-binding protein, CUT1 family [Actinacidiphila bryophytorum]